MARVTNSVLQIRDECNRMNEIVKGMNMVNLNNVRDRLFKELDTLTSIYDTTPDDYAAITKQKRTTESVAVEFEYYIQAYTEHLKDRYKLRNFIKQFYSDIDYAFKVVSELDDEDVVLWANFLRFAIKLKDKSNHILLVLTDGDEEMIRIVTMSLKDIKDKYPKHF